MRKITVIFTTLMAMLLSGCSTTYSGFSIQSVGMPKTTAVVAGIVDKIIPKPKLENCLPGQVLVSESQAAAGYRSDSNPLNGSGFGGGNFGGGQQVDRRNLRLPVVDEAIIFGRKEMYCAWPIIREK